MTRYPCMGEPHSSQRAAWEAMERYYATAESPVQQTVYRCDGGHWHFGPVHRP